MTIRRMMLSPTATQPRTAIPGQLWRHVPRWLVVLPVALLLPVTTGAAQAHSTPTAAALASPIPGRLTVRPRELATGTRTERAGRQPLDPHDPLLAGASVYVPSSCVGTRRCPLLLIFPANIMAGGSLGEAYAHAADQSGVIVLAAPLGSYALEYTNAGRVTVDPGVPYLIREAPDIPATRRIDAALTWVLQHLAIDPTRIAISGNSNDAVESMFFGRVNPDVFSRVAITAPPGALPFDGAGPRDTAGVQYYVSCEVLEPSMISAALKIAQFLQRDGYAVKLVLKPRGHLAGGSPEDFRALLRWLQASWATPALTRQITDRRPATAAEPLVTAATLAQWLPVWRRYTRVLDSVGMLGWLANVQEVPVLLGRQPMALLLTDMPALAGKYPAAAAALTAQGWTVEQAEAYRIALLSAWTTLSVKREEVGLHQAIQPLSSPAQAELRQIQAHGDTLALVKWIARQQAVAEQHAVADGVVWDVAPTSVLGRNMAFLAAHPTEVQALAADSVWARP